MAKKHNGHQGATGEDGDFIPKDAMNGAGPLVEALKQAMREHEVAPEVQEEALRTVAEAAKGAATVDAAQLDAIARSAEARANVTSEALKLAASAEERRNIQEGFMKADERDAQERRDSAERSTETQRGMATIGGKLLIGAAAIAGTTLLIGGTAYASSKGWLDDIAK